LKSVTYLVLLDVVGASTVRIFVRLPGSSRREGGIDGLLEQWVGFAGILFGKRLPDL